MQGRLYTIHILNENSCIVPMDIANDEYTWMQMAYLLGYIIHQHCPMCSSEVGVCDSAKLHKKGRGEHIMH